MTKFASVWGKINKPRLAVCDSAQVIYVFRAYFPFTLLIVLRSTLQSFRDSKSTLGAHFALTFREKRTTSSPNCRKIHIQQFFKQQIPLLTQPFFKE